MKKLLSALLFTAALALGGAELFVGQNAQFKTIGAGIRAMKPGDTLTILPGVYRESIEVANLGAPDKQTLIRAKLPGTVLLHGGEGTARETKRRLDKAGLLREGEGEILITESLDDPQRIELAQRLLEG